MKLIRDPRSMQALEQDPTSFDLAALSGHRHVLLVTTRRNGQQLATPMWFAADGNRRLLLRSGATDPKLTRIRRHPSVNVAACTPRGRPLGPLMRARARILEREDEEAQAERVLKRTLGWQRMLYNLVRAPLLHMAYIEVTPAEPDDATDR